jgi:hypothetical protein
MNKKVAIFLFSLLVLMSCHKYSFDINNLNTFKESTVLYKNFKFFDNIKFDSVFYYLYIDSLGNDPKPVYINENIERSHLSKDKDIILHFLNSLQIYNSIYRKSVINSNVLTINHFFKNKSFKSKYTYFDNGNSITLENLDQMNEYNFAGNVILNDSIEKVEIFIPSTNCKMTFSSSYFQKELIFMKLGNLFK